MASKSPMASTWATDPGAVRLHKSVRVTVGSIVTNLIPTAIVAFFVYTSVPGAAVGQALMYPGIVLGSIIFAAALGGAVVAVAVGAGERRHQDANARRASQLPVTRGVHVKTPLEGMSALNAETVRIPMARLWTLLAFTAALIASRIVSDWWFFATNGAGSAARTDVGPGPVVLTSWVLYLSATVVAFWTFRGVRRYENAVMPAIAAETEAEEEAES